MVVAPGGRDPCPAYIIQGFVGSMDYIRAKKGVILTTSQFTRDALDFVDRIEAKKVVLIDGPKLAELMIEHNVGVKLTKVYELKEVSNDFSTKTRGSHCGLPNLRRLELALRNRNDRRWDQSGLRNRLPRRGARRYTQPRSTGSR